VFSLKRSTACVEQKKNDRRQCVVLELAPLRGGKNFKPHPQTGSWYLHLYYRRVPPPSLGKPAID